MQQVKNFDALPDGRLGAKKSAPEKAGSGDKTKQDIFEHFD